MIACSQVPVLIIHADPFARSSLAAMLANRPAFEVRAVSQDASGLAATRGEWQDGVVLCDLATALRLTSLPIAVASACDREWELRSALERRVRGYVSPGFDTQQLADCLTAVHRGGRYLCPRTAARLAESLSYEALTDRETAVVQLVVRGLANKSIGRELDISVGTVKSHLKSAYAKLEVTSRTQAIAQAQRRGLLKRTSEAAVVRATAGTVTLHAIMSPTRTARRHAGDHVALQAA